MAESSAPPPAPGSRAIKIPVPALALADYPAPSRRRRSERYLKNVERAEASDAGPSSLGSDQDSAWSDSPGAGRAQDRLQTMASPPTQGGRFPASSTPTSDATPSQRKDKHRADYPAPNSMPMLYNPSPSPLGPSMLASSSYDFINLNAHYDDPSQPLKMLVLPKKDQGFSWNEEIFRDSYGLGRYTDRRRRKQYEGDFGDDDHCPVAEIFVTDEEAEAMMP